MEEVRAFVEGAAPEAASKPERKGAYKHVGRTLRRFAYRRLGKKGKGW